MHPKVKIAIFGKSQIFQEAPEGISSHDAPILYIEFSLNFAQKNLPILCKKYIKTKEIYCIKLFLMSSKVVIADA